MYLAVDAHYQDDNSATIAGVLFPSWSSGEVEAIIIEELANIDAYEPGAFYKRELPCISALLKSALLKKAVCRLNAIVIDGYVTLGSNASAGLGMHLYESLDKQVPIIGAAPHHNCTGCNKY